jgi:hypothetical protein
VVTQACEVYRRNNGVFPPDLEALAQPQPNGDGAILYEQALQDSWGRPWGYDPAGPRNGGARPDVWCNRPDGQVVGNWPAGP